MTEYEEAVEKWLKEQGKEVSPDKYDDRKPFLCNNGKLRHWANSACDGWTIEGENKRCPFESKSGCGIPLHQAIRMRDDGMPCHCIKEIKNQIKPFSVELRGKHYLIVTKFWDDTTDDFKADVQLLEKLRKEGKLLNCDSLCVKWKK